MLTRYKRWRANIFLFLLSSKVRLAQIPELDFALHRVAFDRAGVFELNFLSLRVHLDGELDLLALDRAFERRFAEPPFVRAGQFLAILLQNERGIGSAVRRFKGQFPIA